MKDAGGLPPTEAAAAAAGFAAPSAALHMATADTASAPWLCNTRVPKDRTHANCSDGSGKGGARGVPIRIANALQRCLPGTVVRLGVGLPHPTSCSKPAPRLRGAGASPFRLCRSDFLLHM